MDPYSLENLPPAGLVDFDTAINLNCILDPLSRHIFAAMFPKIHGASGQVAGGSRQYNHLQ